MLNVDVSRWPPLTEGDETVHDFGQTLSLDLIRQHTKTDDVPGVTDEILRLYRAAAVEAAEAYTGMLLACQRSVSEPVQGPAALRPGRSTYRFRLRYPVADGLVYLYGSRHQTGNFKFQVPIGTRTIQVPVIINTIDLSNCCNPCAPAYHLNGDLMAMYKAGFASPERMPASIIVGMLQFLAWLIEHPGDEFLTARNRLDSRSSGGGVYGTNNIAFASGAIETWRIIDPDAI
jgi:hypothetical protein